MFIGVDGTGDSDDAVYARDMRNSFINRLVRECPEAHRVYLRGPSLLGWETEDIAENVAEIVRRRRAAAPSDTRILLAGYSRGGAVVIRAAQIMTPGLFASDEEERRAPTIACMALFDAVDRDVRSESWFIPPNVERVYHARQDYAASQSRSYFYNHGLGYDCGSVATREGSMTLRRFFATHAGMGGVPWTGDHPTHFVLRCRGGQGTVGDGSCSRGIPAWEPVITREQDERGAAQVHTWMWENVRRHGMVPP